jgi:opacity protein-like surface antigen
VYLGYASVVHAQSPSSDAGWGFIAEVVHQLGDDISFNGGSSIDLDDELGLGIAVGYRFNRQFELEFGLDWEVIDYDSIIKLDSGTDLSAPGELEIFDPHLNATYNFGHNKFVPYVTAGLGWAWIDTNIPTSLPQTACWWDPWWGYYCGTFQNTKSVDEFSYNAGLGVRWDIAPGYSLRFGYQKNWIDLGEATSTPGLDQFKLSFMMYQY